MGVPVNPPVPDYAREAKREDRRWSAIGAFAVIAAIEALVIGVLVLQVEEQNTQLTTQADQLTQIIDAEEQRQVTSERRLNEALVQVEDVLIDHFALHDENVAEKLNGMLARIEALVARPAGTPPEPVAARPVVPAPRHEPTVTPQPAPTTTTPARTSPTTTTTTPDQRSCAKRPNGPRC